MGKSLSVIKSHRQDDKRKQKNLYYKDSITKYRKQVRRMIEKSAEHADIMTEYRKFTSFVDKAVKHNILHKNTAARKKSRLNVLIKTYKLGA